MKEYPQRNRPINKREREDCFVCVKDNMVFKEEKTERVEMYRKLVEKNIALFGDEE